jgi:hypothetical protein
MRGMDEASGALFSYVDLEERVPAGHPLRTIRRPASATLTITGCPPSLPEPRPSHSKGRRSYTTDRGLPGSGGPGRTTGCGTCRH